MNSNFIKRVFSALLLFPLLTLLIFKGPYSLLFFTLIFCLSIAWYEWKKLFSFPISYFFYGFLLLFFSLWILNRFSPLYLFFFLFLLSFLPQMFNFEQEKFKNIFFPFFIGLIYLTLGFGTIKILIQSYSREILFFLFCVVFANDTGAYLVGKKWGKSPFFSKISPKKTWEGLFGGLFFALILGFLLNAIFSLWSYISLLTLVLMLSFCAVMGDLFESAVKRLTGKKDSGIIIPGHGGLLDRIDGVIFASPLYLFFLEVLNYGVSYRLGL
ncbi:MAG: phosphatidate cytidylyltransferase [Caldimicrobium sp.]